MNFLKIIKNYFFCLKYPFYKIYNVRGKFIGYNYTWYDAIPEGWQKAFGKQLSLDLRAQLKNEKQLKEFRFAQIKEKYGTLRLYPHTASEEAYSILEFYELLSFDYCIICGKPTKYFVPGYFYLCEDCIKKLPFDKDSYEPIQEFIRINKDKPLNEDQIKDYIHLMRPWQTVEEIKNISKEEEYIIVKYTRKIGEYY